MVSVRVESSILERIIALLRPARSESQRRAAGSTGEPTVIKLPARPETRTLLEKWGFTVSLMEGDLLSVRPPRGWTIKAGELEGWSVLLDPQGRERVKVFSLTTQRYRRRSVKFLPCIVLKVYGEGEVVNGEAHVRVSTGTVVVYRTSYTTNGDLPKAHKAAREDVSAWLQANLPEWQDPEQYWEREFLPAPEAV